jgi:hypothetical protein
VEGDEKARRINGYTKEKRKRREKYEEEIRIEGRRE